MRRLLKYSALAFIAGVLSYTTVGCSEDYLETTPTTKVDKEIVFSTTKNAYMALNGMYRHMYQYLGAHDQAGHMSVMHAMDLMGEDLFPVARGYGWYVSDYNYTSARNITSARIEYVWSLYYDIVNNSNQIITKVPDAVGPDTEKNHILGQAYAMRAFGHFMNVQIYAKPFIGNGNALGIPVYTEPTSVGKARSTVAEVYAQIVTDLNQAETLLTGNTLAGPISYVNLKVVQGLKARVALVMGDWATAEAYAKLARTGKRLMSQELYIGKPVNGEDLAGGAFTVKNEEWMWGSEINDEQSTIFGSWLSHLDPTTYGYAQLGNMKIISKYLYDSMSATDVRKQSFCDADGVWAHDPTGYWDWNPYQMYKFRASTDGWKQDYLYMRAAEMYLIEAEAIARQGGRDAAAAQVLYELVFARDENYVLSTATGLDLVNEILLQRRLELIGEGFRWLDIKRMNLPLVRTTGNPAFGVHDAGLAIETNIPAGDNRLLFLIPKQEIDSNPLMIQNDL